MSLQIIVPESRFPTGLPDFAADESGPFPGISPLQTYAKRLATEHHTVAAGAELGSFLGSEKRLFIVLDGWLFKHTILEDGRRQILDFLLPGDLITGLADTGHGLAQSIEAVTNASIAVIPMSAVSELSREVPSLAVLLLESAQDTLNTAYENLVDTGRRTSLEAVAHLLIRLEGRAIASLGADEKGAVPFPLIQEHIGDAIGLTAVHVCRTLRKLKTAGVIEMGRGWLRITDRQQLSDIAGLDDADTCGYRTPVHRMAS